MRSGLTDVEIEALATRVRRHPDYGPPVGAEDLARRVLDDYMNIEEPAAEQYVGIIVARAETLDDLPKLPMP